MSIETLLSGTQQNGEGGGDVFPYVAGNADAVTSTGFLSNTSKAINACDFVAECGLWYNFPAAVNPVSALRLKADYVTSSNGATNCQIDATHSRMDFDYSINGGANWSDTGIGDIPAGNSGSIDILLGTTDPTLVRIRIAGIAYSVCAGGASSCDVNVTVTNIRLEATVADLPSANEGQLLAML
jgi:hypothetical protein